VDLAESTQNSHMGFIADSIISTGNHEGEQKVKADRAMRSARGAIAGIVSGGLRVSTLRLARADATYLTSLSSSVFLVVAWAEHLN
jgi:hypothetical protein